MLEGQLADPDAPLVAGFKMPFMFKAGGMKVGVVPYTTDGLGASYGFELLNTGAVRNVRISEHRNETSAQQYLGTASPALGAAFIVWDPKFFANLSRWTPNHAGDASGKKLSSTYIRAAYLPNVGGWDLGAGVQSWSGRSEDATGGALADTKAWAVDFQAQGAVANLPLGIYLTHANAAGTPAGAAVKNLFNANPNDKTATVIMAELGVLPNKATLVADYLWANTGSADANSGDNALTLGATYQIAQNVRLQVEHSTRSKGGATNLGRYDGSAVAGDALTTFMLSAGF